jgi:hypothetical protein
MWRWRRRAWQQLPVCLKRECLDSQGSGGWWEIIQPKYDIDVSHTTQKITSQLGSSHFFLIMVGKIIHDFYDSLVEIAGMVLYLYDFDGCWSAFCENAHNSHMILNRIGLFSMNRIGRFFGICRSIRWRLNPEYIAVFTFSFFHFLRSRAFSKYWP